MTEQNEPEKTVRDHRHQAQAHAAELSQAVGDPLKALRKKLKVGPDIRTQTVAISYALRGVQGFSQEQQVERLTAVLAQIEAIELPTAEQLKEAAHAALTEALADLENLSTASTEAAQAHLDGLGTEVAKALRLAENRDFTTHQQRKHAHSYGQHHYSPYGAGSGLESGGTPLQDEVSDEAIKDMGDVQDEPQD